MRKMTVALAMAALLTTMAAAPAFADGWGYPYHHGGVVVDPLLWPVAAALTLPAAIVGTVANALVPPPVAYGYPAAPAYSAPVAYAPYYAPRPYPYYYGYGPGVYVAPRGYYYGPRGYYYGTRGYYHARGYRYYRRW